MIACTAGPYILYTTLSGLIGQEFLASFIAAQANHLLAVGNLAVVHAATAASALGGLASFESVDAASAAAIRSI